MRARAAALQARCGDLRSASSAVGAWRGETAHCRALRDVALQTAGARGRARVQALVAAWAGVARGAARCNAVVTVAVRRANGSASRAVLGGWRGVVVAGGEARGAAAQRVVQVRKFSRDRILRRGIKSSCRS